MPRLHIFRRTKQPRNPFNLSARPTPPTHRPKRRRLAEPLSRQCPLRVALLRGLNAPHPPPTNMCNDIGVPVMSAHPRPPPPPQHTHNTDTARTLARTHAHETAITVMPSHVSDPPAPAVGEGGGGGGIYGQIGRWSRYPDGTLLPAGVRRSQGMKFTDCGKLTSVCLFSFAKITNPKPRSPQEWPGAPPVLLSQRTRCVRDARGCAGRGSRGSDGLALCISPLFRGEIVPYLSSRTTRI